MIKAILTPKGIAILVLAAVCVSASVLMAWSELGYTGKFPEWIAWLMQPLGISAQFNQLSDGPGKELTEFLTKAGAKSNFGDYGYALFMFVAMCAAAIAIMIIGREDSEEKTVIPAKK